MQLADVLAALNGLPPEERGEIEREALAATEGMRFVPLPGPQTEGYLSQADIMLYGGEPGGGKTALEVGLALNEHRRSLIVRRNFVDLGGVLHTMDNILGKQNCASGGNRPYYETEDGRLLQFMGMGEDISGKQGNPFDLICCGLGTPVLMADGTFLAIESVLPGQMVATLEGPRRVLRAFPSPAKPSVRVTARGVSQVQSASHKLLTTAGWVDHRAYASASQLSTSAPTGSRTRCISSAESCQTGRPVSRIHARQGLGPRLQGGWRRVVLAMAGAASLVTGACKAQEDQGNVCAVSGGTNPPTGLLQGWSALTQALLQPLLLMGDAAQKLARCAPAYADSCAARTSAPQGSTGRCSSELRRGGERTLAPSGHHSGQGGGQQGLLLLADVGPQTPIDSPAGGQAQVPRHSRRTWSYAHPYTKGARQSTADVEMVPCEVEQVGAVPLFDLEIDEVRHFITAGGFINKNCVDEAAQVPEHQMRMLLGWLRTDKPDQRTRVVLGSNPPLDSVGDWLVDFFAPWLDDRHPNPAEPGELRWFLPNENDDGYRECAEGESIVLHGVKVMAHSRTFIRSRFTDNPFYNEADYAKSLSNLPAAVRERLMSGNFMSAREDPPWQAIPSDWVRQAVARWTPQPPVGVPMCSIGVDVAQGGTDESAIARRYDSWFAPLICEPGHKTPGGTDVAALVIKHRHDGAKVIVDVGGGWGGEAHGHLMKQQVDSVAYMGVKKSLKRTVDNQLTFTNVRTEAYWRLREALDPDQLGGSQIALPNDKKLISDLTSPEYRIGPQGIELEAKEKLTKRLGRSTDRGDAVVMAWWSGARMASNWRDWAASGRPGGPRAVMGHQAARRRVAA